MIAFTVFLGSFLATYFGVAWLRSWTLRRGIIDHPNDRSSHTAPTPRGGGLVIAIIVIATYCGLGFGGILETSWSYVIGSALIVLISWLDDVYSVSFVWRFFVHAAAALTLILGNGYFSIVGLPYFGTSIDLGFGGAAITFCVVIWLINAYNFMDGIDGLAGSQAVTAGIGWMMLGLGFEIQEVMCLAGLIIFTNFAFLLHNWPPARIFMGDAGSAFLGFTFAALPLIAAHRSPQIAYLMPLAGVVLVWFFVFDSLATFIRRGIEQKKVWQAHREHLYQRLVISGMTHLRVTYLYTAFSFLLALGVAFTILRQTLPSLVLLLTLLLTFTTTLIVVCQRKKCLIGAVP